MRRGGPDEAAPTRTIPFLKDQPDSNGSVRCQRCHRPITTPLHTRIGLGPHCLAIIVGSTR
jgi:hypothetical protein